MLDTVDGRGRVLCAVLVALSSGVARTIPALLISLIFPCVLWIADGTTGGDENRVSLWHVNIFTLFLWITLPFTGGGKTVGGIFSTSGLRLALLLTIRINVIALTCIRLVATMDIGTLAASLKGLGMPKKLVTLLLLTYRYSVLLRDRFVRVFRGIALRGSEMTFRMYLFSFAYFVGSALVYSADRAERSNRAILCRGGVENVSLFRKFQWKRRDWALLAAALSHCIAVYVLNGV